MTPHLSPAELIDAADGVLAPAKAAHLDACPECGAQAADLAGLARTAGAVEMPEPSPLFWDHFSARIAAAVRAERPAPAPLFGGLGGWTMRGAAVSVMVVLVAMSGAWVAHQYRAAGAANQRQVTPVDETADLWSDDTPLDILTSMAADVPSDEGPTAGLTVRSGAVETAVQGLSQDERNELGRLLQDEMKRSSN